MVATVQIGEKNGAGATFTDKTSSTVRFKNADDATVDLNNVMVVPGAGSDWSFQKWLRAKFTVGPGTQITNLRVYSDGANGFGTGINLWAKAVTAYSTPAEETASAGYTNFFTYTSGSALLLGAGPLSGTGEKGDHCVMAMEVQSTAGAGVLTAETLTLAWDEI